MEPLFTVEQNPDLAAYRKLIGAFSKKRLIMSSAYFVLIGVAFLLRAILRRDPIYYALGGVFIVIAFAVPFIHRLETRKTFESAPGHFQSTIRFYEDRVEAESAHGLSKLAYTDFYRFAESKDCFWMMPAKNTTIPFFKADAPEGLLPFLREKASLTRKKSMIRKQ